MPLYTYRAKNESGRISSGEVKVASRNDLVAILSQKGFTPIDIQEKNVFTDVSQLSIFKKKVKIKDLAVFCRQFAIVLEAGVPIAGAMDVLREQAQNPTLKEVLTDVYDNIQKGISLSESMKQHAEVFPEILINMIEAGEVSGQLDIVLKRMADHFEKEFKLNQKIKSAMTYPVILCIVAVIVISVLMLNVIPTFADVLKGMGSELPIYTRILVAVSEYFKNFWWLNFIIIIGIVAGSRGYLKTPDGKRFFGRLAISVPIVKGIVRAVLTSRFTRTLGTLVGSGVLLIQSLEIVRKIIGNTVVQDKLDFVIDEIKKGRGLTQPLTQVGYFPPMLVSMVRIGEESGSIDFALNKAADFYDEEVETAMNQMTTIIEPMITIAMGAVVAFIIISILVPMISVYQGFANQSGG